MADRHSLSFRTTPDKIERLDQLAKATNRARSWLLDQALEAYLDAQAWQIAHIERGLGELRWGEGVSHDEVARRIRSWVEEAVDTGRIGDLSPPSEHEPNP
ncbi:MAG: ribbon-helix-helix domain-containing protein [Alphaproteobacteria bacterium]|nr:ribbon-helix-helix domain-containing protein [Alphaproteobacteria bacterium]